jgi:hypothetical protein
MLHFTFPQVLRCAGKTPHKTIKAAAKELKRSNGPRMKVYKCEHCGAYHIGHAKRGK